MKQTINVYDFIDAFQRIGRGNQFSHAGLEAMFEYLDELEEETGNEMELDVIALCCDFAEYESLEAFNDDYFAKGQEKNHYSSVENLRDETTVIEFDGGIIVQAF